MDRLSLLCVTLVLLVIDSLLQHNIQKQPMTARMDEKLQQTMTLTARRLDIHQQVWSVVCHKLYIWHVGSFSRCRRVQPWLHS